MKILIILLSLMATGCGSYNNGRTSEKMKLPIENGLYKPVIGSYGERYDLFELEHNGLVSLTTFAFYAENFAYNGTDSSNIDGGRIFISLTENGWEFAETETRGKYQIESNELVGNYAFVPMVYKYKGTKLLSNIDIESVLKDDFSWAAGHEFSEGAKQYFYQKTFLEDTWVIESEPCGQNCYGIGSLGNGSLDEWRDQYSVVENINASNGFYWLGMALFFDEEGSTHIYSYFFPDQGLLTDEGNWEIKEVNGEEILEITIPFATKKQFSIKIEANPIISKVSSTLFKGVKYSSTNSVPEIYLAEHYFLNSIANEDLENAFKDAQ